MTRKEKFIAFVQMIALTQYRDVPSVAIASVQLALEAIEDRIPDAYEDAAIRFFEWIIQPVDPENPDIGRPDWIPSPTAGEIEAGNRVLLENMKHRTTQQHRHDRLN